MSLKRSLKSLLGVLTLTLVICVAVTGCKKGGEKPKEGAKESASTSAPGAKTTSSDEAAAYVNGEKILKSDLDAIVSMYSGGGALGGQHTDMQLDEERLKELRTKMLDQMIDGEILYQQSQKFPVEDLDEKAETEFAHILQQYGTEEKFAEEVAKNNLTIEKVKANLRKNISIQNYIDNEILAKIEISDDDIKKYYEENKKNYETTDQVKASHILIKVEENATQEQKDEAMAKIKKVKDRLNAGEDFAAVAKEASEGPTGPNGGDLGYFGRNQMVKPFEDAAFALNPGEISDIVETQFGYHIIKLTEKRGAEAKTFDDVKATIEESLKRRQFQDKITKIVEGLKADAKIEIVD